MTFSDVRVLCLTELCVDLDVCRKRKTENGIRAGTTVTKLHRELYYKNKEYIMGKYVR